MKVKSLNTINMQILVSLFLWPLDAAINELMLVVSIH